MVGVAGWWWVESGCCRQRVIWLMQGAWAAGCRHRPWWSLQSPRAAHWPFCALLCLTLGLACTLRTKSRTQGADLGETQSANLSFWSFGDAVVMSCCQGSLPLLQAVSWCPKGVACLELKTSRLGAMGRRLLLWQAGEDAANRLRERKQAQEHCRARATPPSTPTQDQNPLNFQSPAAPRACAAASLCCQWEPRQVYKGCSFVTSDF